MLQSVRNLLPRNPFTNALKPEEQQQMHVLQRLYELHVDDTLHTYVDMLRSVSCGWGRMDRQGDADALLRRPVYSLSISAGIFDLKRTLSSRLFTLLRGPIFKEGRFRHDSGIPCCRWVRSHSLRACLDTSDCGGVRLVHDAGMLMTPRIYCVSSSKPGAPMCYRISRS